MYSPWQGSCPFDYQVLQPIRIEPRLLENLPYRAMAGKVDDVRLELRCDFSGDLIGRRAHDCKLLLVRHITGFFNDC